MPSKIRRTKLLTVWLPPSDLAALEKVARDQDSDRSKLVRAAVRAIIAGKRPSKKEAA